MIPVDPNDCFCGDAEEGAALGLLGLMTGISEEFYCASWLIGLEHSLWIAATGGNRKFGMGTISERQCQLLRLLSDECGGWWRWGDTAGPTFVRLENWPATRAALQQDGEG